MVLVSIIIAGVALGFSLIVSIGPQNIFLIKQGIKRDAVTAIVAVCLLSDVVVYVIAVTGVGTIVERAPLFLEILKWVGVAYLGWFAVQAFRDAFARTPSRVEVVEESESPSDDARPATVAVKHKAHVGRKLQKPILTTLMITWVNPNTWIDAVVIGGIAAQYGDTGRWLFIVGTMIASAIWFPLVGYGAGALSRPLSNPRVWRVLNVIIGLILAAIAIKLALL